MTRLHVFWTDFDANGTRNVHEILRKTQHFRAQAGSGKRCFDCAGASGSRVGPFRKPQKNIQETRLANHYARDVVVLQKTVKK